MQKQSFIKGTFILSTSAFITRVMGFISGIYLARLLGAEGMGLLVMAHPLVPLTITLTELGLPVAISKLVAEADSKGDHTKVRRILFVSLFITGTLSIVLTSLSLIGSKFIASILLTDQRAYYAMVAITPIAPIVAISAVLKGYFRGKQNMKPIAYSEVIEHIAQITCILALVHLLMPYGIEYAIAGAMAGYVASEITGLLFLFTNYRRNHKNNSKEKLTVNFKQGKQTLFELLHIGLPTTGHGIVHSLYGAFQPMLITKSLALAGIGTAIATKQYGMLAGFVFPLLYLPTFVTQSLSTALVPAISEANVNRNNMIMHRRIDEAVRITFIVGAPCTVILYNWATPLTTLIYNAPEAAVFLKMLAPIFFFFYFNAPLHGILLGLGKANIAMGNFFVATCLKAMAIFVLGTVYGIHGVVLGINFGLCLMTFLNFFSVSSAVGIYLDMRYYIKAFICMVLMAITGQSMLQLLQNTDMGMLFSLIISLTSSLIVYTMALLITKTINRNKALDLT